MPASRERWTLRLAGIAWAAVVIGTCHRRGWQLLADGAWREWWPGAVIDGGWRPPWPWAVEAAARSGGAAAGAALVLAAGWFLGALLLKAVRWRSESRVESAVFQLASGAAALSYLSLALAWVGLYRPPVVWAMIAILATAAACRAGRRLRWPQAARALTLPPPDILPWLLTSAAALLVGFIGALAPETEYDALWYHLWLPRVWLSQGHPVDLVTDYISLYPMTWELLFGNASVVGGAPAAKLLHFACLPLAGAATWLLARRLVSEAEAWIAVAVLFTTPTVLWESTTAYVDLATACYSALGIYTLLEHVVQRRPGGLPMAAWFLGLAAALKHLGLVLVATAAAGLLIRGIVRARRSPHAARSMHITRALREPAALVAAALLLASPWYARAWSASGNPFFPELYKVFGAQPAERWDAQTERGLDAFKAHFGYPRSAVTLAALPWNVTQHAARFGGSLGAAFLLVIPWLFTGRIGAVARWLLFLAAGYTAVWASPLASFQLRFLVPIVPALAALTAGGMARLGQLLGASSWERGARAFLACLLLSNLPPFISLQEGDRVGWNGWLTHVMRDVPAGVVLGRESAASYLSRRVATYGAWQFLARASPQSATVLEVGGGDNYYATRARLQVDATAARGAWSAGPTAVQDTLKALDRLGIDYVLFDRAWLERMAGDRAALASPRFRADHLVLEYEDERALVYRFAPTASSAVRLSFLAP
jgi:hypothetical protein